MYFISIFLWVIGTFILANNDKKESDRWFGYAIILYGIAGISVILREQADLGYLRIEYSAVAAAMGMLYAPFAYLVAILYYTGLMPKAKKKALLVILICALPSVLYSVIFPVIDCFSYIEPRELSDYYAQMKILYVAPYYLGGTGLMTWHVMRRGEHQRRKENISTFFLTVPTGMLYYTIGYILPGFGQLNIWKTIPAITLAIVLAFLYFVIRGNAIGLSYLPHNTSRAKMENLILEGTVSLQKELATDIARIEAHLSSALEAFSSRSPSDSGLRQHAITETDLAIEVCDATLLNLKRVYNKMNPLKPKMQLNQIQSVMETAVEQAKGQVKARQSDYQYVVTIKYEANPLVLCDFSHLSQAIQDLVLNSFEAMPSDGTGILEIKVMQFRRWALLLIKDNGSGMDLTHSRRLGIPLLTNKQDRAHDGLGLYYVRKVIEMHNGHFNMKNTIGGGMTAEILLPISDYAMQSIEII